MKTSNNQPRTFFHLKKNHIGSYILIAHSLLVLISPYFSIESPFSEWLSFLSLALILSAFGNIRRIPSMLPITTILVIIGGILGFFLAFFTEDFSRIISDFDRYKSDIPLILFGLITFVVLPVGLSITYKESQNSSRQIETKSLSQLGRIYEKIAPYLLILPEILFVVILWSTDYYSPFLLAVSLIIISLIAWGCAKGRLWWLTLGIMLVLAYTAVSLILIYAFLSYGELVPAIVIPPIILASYFGLVVMLKKRNI